MSKCFMQYFLFIYILFLGNHFKPKGYKKNFVKQRMHFTVWRYFMRKLLQYSYFRCEVRKIEIFPELRFVKWRSDCINAHLALSER